jgi:cytochrome c biogenesis protein CcdA
MVISGDTALHETIGDASLAELLENAPENPFWLVWDREQEIADAKNELNSLIRSFSFAAVLLAGLFDGINPCAFAVIVFLVSYLGLSRRGGRRTALVFGLLFTLGVFLCYFLIGLGLSEVLGFLHGHRGIIRVIFAGMGGLCLIFAVLAVWDTWRARREGAAAMRFGMPKSFHRAAHTLIRNQAGRGALGLGTVLLGMTVSTIELVCTGQIYFPALVLMNQAGRNARSLALLLAYNLAFIVPLVLVVLLAAYGVGSQQLAAWARRHAVLTRAFTAVLFLALAILLAILAWRG